MFSLSDQLATAQILFQLRQESSQSPEEVNSCIPVTTQSQIHVPLVKKFHESSTCEQVVSSNFFIKRDHSSGVYIGQSQTPFFDNSSSLSCTKPHEDNIEFNFFRPNNKQKPILSLVQTEAVDSLDRDNHPTKRFRRVSVTTKEKPKPTEAEISSLSSISSEESATFILPSSQKGALSFPHLQRPPSLPSPKMNLVGVSFPMFFTPQQFDKGRATKADNESTFHPSMICQNIVEDGSQDSNAVTERIPESPSFPQENSKDMNLLDPIKTKEKRKRRTYQKKTKICRMHECSSEAAKNTPYCQQHSGTRICEYKGGCTKCAQGRTRFCIGHGGGRRCTFPGCNKGARDHRFCAAHGGGRRCNVDNCNKSAVGGTFKCSGHGGGRRCQMENCDKCAQSGTKFCVKHGGGKRCAIDGCSKVARGKSNLCLFHR